MEGNYVTGGSTSTSGSVWVESSRSEFVVERTVSHKGSEPGASIASWFLACQVASPLTVLTVLLCTVL